MFLNNRKCYFCRAFRIEYPPVKSKNVVLPLLFLMAAFIACHKETSSDPTPYTLVIPAGLPPMNIPADNPLTVEGVALGRKLFYDPLLSGDNTLSCAGCHRQQQAFAGPERFSKGIAGQTGRRNAMPLYNLGWQRKFFWDGRALSLEAQALMPIQDPVEMHQSLSGAVAELQAHPEYPVLFERAFGTDRIDSALIARAIAQFERTLVSGNARFDRWKSGAIQLTDAEMRGMALFNSPQKGDCTHCHVLGSTFSDFEFRNTGLDSIPSDAGLAEVTGLPTDAGKFKTPSLRNVEYTAPYMHDGRFNTLEEVIQHYNTGFFQHPNLDVNLAHAQKGRLTAQDIDDMIAFLKTLSDPEFLQEPAFGKPE